MTVQIVKPTPKWIDISNPDEQTLDNIASTYSLHRSSVQDCLDPKHYPKFENIEGTDFVIIRCFDNKANKEASDLLSLTRKIAIFLGKDFIITVHRADHEFIQKLREQVKETFTPQEIAIRLLKKSVESFYPYLELLEQDIESLEKGLILKTPKKSDLFSLYTLRTKLSVVKRQAYHGQIVIRDFVSAQQKKSPWLVDLKETTEALWQYCDELMEDVQNLLSLFLALSSQRTNEVMRFLTVISLFFLPLTFIVGVYGMNFKFMPELDWEYGYLMTWTIMFVVCMYIYQKAKKKGWLERE